MKNLPALSKEVDRKRDIEDKTKEALLAAVGRRGRLVNGARVPLDEFDSKKELKRRIKRHVEKQSPADSLATEDTFESGIKRLLDRQEETNDAKRMYKAAQDRAGLNDGNGAGGSG